MLNRYFQPPLKSAGVLTSPVLEDPVLRWTSLRTCSSLGEASSIARRPAYNCVGTTIPADLLVPGYLQEDPRLGNKPGWSQVWPSPWLAAGGMQAQSTSGDASLRPEPAAWHHTETLMAPCKRLTMHLMLWIMIGTAKACVYCWVQEHGQPTTLSLLGSTTERHLPQCSLH